jgi:nucleotide-binding universal stress UspA family protein
MSSVDASGPVLVAFDGSPVARAALAYAARRGGAGEGLVVAHVLAVPPALYETPYYEDSVARLRERGRRVLDDGAALVPEGVPAELRLLDGPPARALVKLAGELDAREIAIGSRGFGAIGRAVLGSTSHALLHEADRPVLVLTRRAADALEQHGAAGPIVVGFDGSDNARAALAYATRRAAAAKGSVIAVTAFHPPADWLGEPYYQAALDENGQRAREIAGEIEGQPGVEVDVVPGSAVEALTRVAEARDAGEIVVGARGLGRFRAALGSVSHALLHEAERPIVIVPPPT